MNPQLFINMGDMFAHRVGADEELLADECCAAPLGHKGEHLALARRETVLFGKAVDAAIDKRAALSCLGMTDFSVNFRRGVTPEELVQMRFGDKPQCRDPLLNHH